MGQLLNTTAYLAGPIDRCPNLGVEWRKWITEQLYEKYQIISYNPMDKPVKIAGEMEGRELRKQWKIEKQFHLLADFIKLIRRVDLRMTDKSDFGIFYIDIDIHMCGSYEELSWMNRCKKPCLVMCKQGVGQIPDWLFGTIPYQHMFSSWDDMFLYLDKINQGYDDGTNRWIMFDY